MRSEEWHKIDELLDAALDLEPAERPQFLDGAGASAPDLRREVESLLACEEQTNGFLEAPALALSADFLADENFTDRRAGEQVGPFRIIREIGRGGMGAVFLAERADGEFEQKVALKVVRRTFVDTDLARRFRQERQILASLNHPNIARLLDGGVSADGEPFLAMEYVEGLRIDAYADAHRLSTVERLQLFRQVCAAVQYAHQNLIIHRDLKPSNILVTADGVPKLLDFGIAKLLDAESDGAHTVTELGVMTPEYASPEQVSGQSVTTASDVYSLGVVLYELLAGRRPFRVKSRQPDEIARAIREQEPSKPSEARSEPPASAGGYPAAHAGGSDLKSLRGDLDNIVLMAMRKEPARRYASVAEFSEDIRRHIDGLPVVARKDTFQYRAGKFINRNKVGVAASLLVVAALVAGLAVALWQANVARRERDRAEQRFADVRQLSNALLTDIAPKIENLQGATEARQAVVTQSLKYLDSLAQETGDDLPLQSELATAYEKVGDIQGNPENPNLGDLAGAIASYEKAQKMRLRLLERDPNNFEHRRLLAANHQSLGYLHWQANELQEAAKQTETALALYEVLAAERPGAAELRLALAQITFDTGDARKDIAKYDEAIAYYLKALDLLAPLLQTDANNVQYLKLAGTCYSKLGNALSWAGRQKEGEAETQKAIRIYESLAANHPNDVSVSNGLWQTYWMASSTYEDNDNALSHEYALKALIAIQSVVAKDPADRQARYRVARTMSVLGQTSTKTGKAAEGLSYLERAVSELTRLIEDEPRSGGTKGNLGATLMRLAEARAKQKDFAGALAELDRSERIYVGLRQADATDSSSLRSQALIWDYRAEIHLEWAKTVTGERRRAHEEEARNSYARTLEILEQIDAQKSLPESDRKWLEKLRAERQQKR